MTPPTQPVPVHNAERPNSLAIRRNRSPGRLQEPHVTTQPSHARPPPAAIDHTEQRDTLASDSEVESEPGRTIHMSGNVEELFNNLASASMLEDQDVLGLTTHRKVDSLLKTHEFEAQLLAKAPELLEQWKQEKQLMYLVQDALHRELENSRQLREPNYTPLPDSEKLADSMRMRKAAEPTGLMSTLPLSNKSSSSTYVGEEVDRIDRNIGSPASPGPSPVKTLSSGAGSSAYSPTLSNKHKFKHEGPGTPKSPKELRYEGDLKALEMRVKLRLLPAIMVLSNPLSNSKDLDLAYDYATSAWRCARTRGNYMEGKALMGMCEYYVGICKLAHSEPSGGRDRGKSAERLFAEASVHAEGVYPEAEFAAQALYTIQSAQRPGSAFSAATSSRPGTADSSLIRLGNAGSDARPGTANSGRPGTPDTIHGPDDEEAKRSSWCGWRDITKNRPRDLSADTYEEENEEESQAAFPPFKTLNANSTNALETDHSPPGSGTLLVSPSKQIQASNIRRIQRGTRIPSFSTQGSEVSRVIQRAETPDSGYDRGGLGDPRLANASASVSGSSHPPVKPTATTTSGVNSSTNQTPPGLIRLPSSPTKSPGGTLKDLPTSITSPVTSPSSSHQKRKPVAFSLSVLSNLTPSGSTRSSPQASPTSIGSATIMARRMGRRISAITTAVHMGDSYRDAEEGRSPYRATFNDMPEEKSREKSAEDMV